MSKGKNCAYHGALICQKLFVPRRRSVKVSLSCLEVARSVCTSQTLLHSESPGGGQGMEKGKTLLYCVKGEKKEASPPPPLPFSSYLGKVFAARCKKGNKKRADAQQRHSVFSPLYQESAVCFTTSWREGKRKGKKCSGADKWKEKWEGERLIWKMEMAPDEIWEKGSVGGRKYCTFIAAALAR